MAADLLASLGTVFLLGVSLGLTACAVTCLPFIGTLVVGKAEGRSAGMRDAALFLCGRLLAYAALGGLAGLIGTEFVQMLAAGTGNAVIGLVSVASGLMLGALPQMSAHAACQRMRASNALPPLAMGVALTLIPCAPLTTLLASSAASGSPLHGTLNGLVFGLGALLTPMLVLIPATASLAQRIALDQPWLVGTLRMAASLVLIAIGLRRIAAASDLAALLAAIVVLLIALTVIVRRFNRRIRAPRQIITVHRISTKSFHTNPL